MFFTSFIHFSYQIMALEFLSASKDRMHRPSKDKFVDFHVPSGLNLLEDKEYASQAALWGIEVISYTTLQHYLKFTIMMSVLGYCSYFKCKLH
jgi:hypothetical protein